MLPWYYNWRTLSSLIWLWTMLQGMGENINYYWLEGLRTNVLTFLLKAEVSLGATTPPHPGISESHSHRAFERASEPSWRKPFGLFQSFFHLRKDLQLCEAENKLIYFEFQRCVVDNEDPDYLFQREPVSLEMLQWLLKAGGDWEALTKMAFLKFQGTSTEFPKMSASLIIFSWERQIVRLTLPLLVKDTRKNNWVDSVVFLPSCADRIIKSPQKHSDNIQ